MLSTLFRPAMFLMSRLGFALKLGLIGVLFVVPLFAVVYFLHEKISSDVGVAKIERLGIEQIEPARRMLEAVQSHRRERQLGFAGDQAAQGRLSGLGATADENLAALRKLASQSSVSLAEEGDLAEIAQAWAALKKTPGLNSQESFTKHTALLEKIFEGVSKISAKSGLALEPEGYRTEFQALLQSLKKSAAEDDAANPASSRLAYALFDIAAKDVDGLLAARIDGLENRLYMILAGTGAVLILVLYLFGGMLLSVLRSLKSIEAGACRLAHGDISQVVDSHSRDELRRVGGAVNSVAQTLQKFTAAQLDMARAHNEEGRDSHEMRAADFEGAYGDMARNLNAMVKGHIDVQKRFVDLMVDYAGGQFGNRMPPLPGERNAISDAAGKVRDGLEAAAKAAEYNARVKAALDNVSIPVRIAGNDGVILYVNRAFHDTMRKYVSAFQRDTPGFDPDKVVGANIGMFLGGSQSASAYLREIEKAKASRMVLGGRDFDVVTTPVIDDRGETLGTAGQWRDITEQLRAENEIGAIVEAAAAGDFSKRIGEAGKSGFLLEMARGLNAILGTSEEALGEISRTLKAMAEGDFESQDRG